MKTQLLMIIAVIVSSLLTISQRANAQEVNQFRWLEPTVEQVCHEVATPDKDTGSDKGCLFSSLSYVNAPLLQSNSYIYETFSASAKFTRNVNPRAPPFSLI